MVYLQLILLFSLSFEIIWRTEYVPTGGGGSVIACPRTIPIMKIQRVKYKIWFGFITNDKFYFFWKLKLFVRCEMERGFIFTKLCGILPLLVRHSRFNNNFHSSTHAIDKVILLITIVFHAERATRNENHYGKKYTFFCYFKIDLDLIEKKKQNLVNANFY